MKKLNAKRNLPRLKEKVFNNPLLITEESILPITNYLKNPDRTFFNVSHEISDLDVLLSEFDYDKRIDSYEEEQLKKLKQRAGLNPDNDIGVIDVSGTLVAKAGQINGCVELTSYEKIKATTAMQIKLGAKSIVYMIDSGGGEAYTAFSTGRDLRKMADAAGIKTYAYVDGMAASGAYMMASAAHEIVANEDSDVGSIGVLVQLINPSKHLQQEGYERTFITAGDHKVPFDKDGNFQEEFINRIQSGVQKTYEKFVTAVSDLRGLSKQEIIDTQARVYDAPEALKIGLVDKIMELEEFENYVSSSVSRSTTSTTTFNIKEDNMSEQKQVTVESLQAEVSTLTTQLADVVASNEQVTAQLSEVTAAKEGLETQLATLQESYDALVVEKEASEKAAQVAKRQASLEAAIGKDNEQLASLLESTAMLEDSAFEIVVKGLSTQQESKQAKLEEKGGEGAPTTAQLSIEEKLAATAKRMTKQPA
ncbi:capsid maturation protease [Acinetobacter phage Phab24]|nr:capsid maturation protease [Acinetobacter phage Phab24]